MTGEMTMTMEPRVSLITLGVSDLEKSFTFYRDGLGFPTGTQFNEPTDGVVFFKTRYTVVAIYPFEKLAEDVGPEFAAEAASGARLRFNGITLAHNVREKGDVDRVLGLAAKAGGKVVKPGQEAFWGGYSGYFSDPDGYLWEVAWGAAPIAEDGSVQFP